MTTDTLAPPPYRVAPDTWVVPELFPAGPDAFVPINSAVIAGAEPVIVDTGTALNRDRWLDAVGSIVDFADVRWVFLSHDDHDHTGNLAEVMELAPQATLVTTWFSLERLAGDMRFPLDRVRWVKDGETFDAGDRTFVAARPPSSTHRRRAASSTRPPASTGPATPSPRSCPATSRTPTTSRARCGRRPSCT